MQKETLQMLHMQKKTLQMLYMKFWQNNFLVLYRSVIIEGKRQKRQDGINVYKFSSFSATITKLLNVFFECTNHNNA